MNLPEFYITDPPKPGADRYRCERACSRDLLGCTSRLVLAVVAVLGCVLRVPRNSFWFSKRNATRSIFLYCLQFQLQSRAPSQWLRRPYRQGWLFLHPSVSYSRLPNGERSRFPMNITIHCSTASTLTTHCLTPHSVDLPLYYLIVTMWCLFARSHRAYPSATAFARVCMQFAHGRQTLYKETSKRVREERDKMRLSRTTSGLPTTRPRLSWLFVALSTIMPHTAVNAQCTAGFICDSGLDLDGCIGSTFLNAVSGPKPWVASLSLLDKNPSIRCITDHTSDRPRSREARP